MNMPINLPALLSEPAPGDGAADPGNAGELINYQTATEMARTFREATEAITRHMLAIHQETDRIQLAFLDKESHPFDLKIYYNGERYSLDMEPDSQNLTDAMRLTNRMEREAWRTLADRLGIRNIMSVKKRTEFDRQMNEGELPPITEETITSILMGLVEQAQDFATEAAKEVFDILRPRSDSWGGKYKTNDHFRVGRKVILPWRVERGYGSGKFRPNYHREQELIALDGVFHLLDGKGIMREHRGPLVSAICASPDGKGETDYFRFKCFKNRNLHLEFKRLDLVKQLNLLAAGEAVLGRDME